MSVETIAGAVLELCADERLIKQLRTAKLVVETRRAAAISQEQAAKAVSTRLSAEQTTGA